MLLKVLYFCLGIGFHASQADNGLPPSNKFSCKTADCLVAPSPPPAATQEGNAYNPLPPTTDVEPPTKIPICSDLLLKGVDLTKVRVGVDCIDVKVPTPSDGCVKPPEQSQTLDYRWENYIYNRALPEGAFVIHYQYFETHYIGQVEIPGAGKCIGSLEPYEADLEVNCNGYYKTRENTKILCVGHEEYYEWKLINNEEEFRAVLKDNELVKGGYNETKKVDTFVGAYLTNPLKFGNIDKEEGTISYDNYRRSVKDGRIEILIYKPPEEPPKEKPNCSDILQKGVDCVDVEVQTQSEINSSASSPNLPNVELPSQTKVESNPTAKINVV